MNSNSVKWAPFNAVIDGNHELRRLNENRNKVIRPTLTNEQLEELEHCIVDYYTSKVLVSVSYYTNYKIEEIKGIITKINGNNKTISIENKNLLFNNIIDIKEVSI